MDLHLNTFASWLVGEGADIWQDHVAYWDRTDWDRGVGDRLGASLDRKSRERRGWGGLARCWFG
jgi:hypothetical protein